MPLLDILLIDDSEKDPSWLEHSFESILQWNSPNSLSKISVLVLSQRLPGARDGIMNMVHPRGSSIGRMSLAVSNCPRTKSGYPLWDIFEDVRELGKDFLTSRFLTVQHPEFLWGPHRLDRTIRFLENNDPITALGNLRRIGTRDRDGLWDPAETERVLEVISQKGLSSLAGEWDQVPSTHWVWWEESGPLPGPSSWKEDIFFIRNEFLEDLRFWETEDRLFFQDVWDPLRALFDLIGEAGWWVPIERMDRQVHEEWHLFHGKGFCYGCEEIRDWFLERPERFQQTTFMWKAMWDNLIALRGETKEVPVQIYEMRGSPGGTLDRFRSKMEGKLKEIDLGKWGKRVIA